MAGIITLPVKHAPAPRTPRHSGRQIWDMKHRLRSEYSIEACDAKIHLETV